MPTSELTGPQPTLSSIVTRVTVALASFPSTSKKPVGESDLISTMLLGKERRGASLFGFVVH
jgi:hypothetical protein